jgi:hypothetical protein
MEGTKIMDKKQSPSEYDYISSSGKRYIPIVSATCEGCAFDEDIRECAKSAHCRPEDRDDSQSIIWKELK